MSRTEEFHIGDLFITHRLVSVSAEAAVRAETEASREPRRWSILLWGDRRCAAQAAAWIGKVVGTG